MPHENSQTGRDVIYFVLNDRVSRFFLTLLSWLLLFSSSAAAQSLPKSLVAKINVALARSQQLRLRAQPDSAFQVLSPVERQLDSLRITDTPIGRNVRLQQSVNQAKSEQYLLALRNMNKVADESCAAGEWQTCASARLELVPLALRLNEKERSLNYVRQAASLVRREGITDLRPQVLYQLANWQTNYGYSDSVRIYLDSLLTLPDVPSQWLAAAYRTYSANSAGNFTVRDSMLRNAAELYLTLNDYEALSAVVFDLSAIHLDEGKLKEGYKLLEDATRYASEGERRGQDVLLVQSLVNTTRSKDFRLRGQPDSAHYYASRGHAQEVSHWRNSSRFKAAEASQLYRNEEQAKLLANRSKELQIERIRSYGLIAFSILILLLGLWTIRLYRQLKKSSELTKQQADSLAEAKDQIEESLRLQIMLKAELQHRVKNNMQLIMSIFNRGQYEIDDPRLRSELNERKEQIKSIALLHQKIDLAPAGQQIDPEEYLRALVTNIEKSYSGIFPEVRLNLELNVDLLHVDTAVPLGLILNELVTNAYKYAFPKGGPGSIDVRFSKLPDHFYLRVADNGVGLPEDVNFRRSNSMGTRLIQGLTRQLDGTIEWVPSPTGTVVQLQFQAGYQELEL